MKLREKRIRPRKLGLYGIHGVGKSSFAAEAPSPIFLDFEGGLGDLDVPATDQIYDFYTLQQNLQWLKDEPHDYATVVIDTMDWLERIVHQEVAKNHNVTSIEQVEFGKGFGDAVPYINFVLSSLDQLRVYRNMMIILLAHAKITKFSPPDSDSYDRYEPALHNTASRLIQEWCDDFLFTKFEIFTRTEKEGFGKERKIAVDTKQRVMFTSESAAMVAKNRLRLPEKMPLSFAAYAEFAYPRQAAATVSAPAVAVSSTSQPSDAGNVAGIVVDGSSKPRNKETVTNG